MEMAASRTMMSGQFKCNTELYLFTQCSANKPVFSVESRGAGSDGSITALGLFLLFAHSVHQQYY